MHIRNHRLSEHWFGKSKDVGSRLAARHFVVLHYTAGGSGAASRDYMMLSPTEKKERLGASRPVYASAHVIIDRDGSLWQIIPFNLKGRHAGISSWKGLESLNQYSIGIEIANYGWLDKQGDGSYKRPDTPRFKARDVTVAPMPNSGEIKGWENYTEKQLEATESLVRSLLGHYPEIREVVGHQEISPGRKFDPGPAFPITRFKNLVDNRGYGAVAGKDDEPPKERYVTTARLNIREGPGTGYEKLPESPLRMGTQLIRENEDGVWYEVRLAKKPSVVGWVHSGYLRLLLD